MKLLIHDLNEKEWKKVADNYDGWEVIYNNGAITPCVGCFGCWIKEPGQCVIKDGYEDTCVKIHKAEQVTIISKYTYGGFSSFVKNVIDRSIGYVAPFFELHKGEMHHKQRYDEYKQIKFIFRGPTITEDDKVKARRYAEAVCTNFHALLWEISFDECDMPEYENKKKYEGPVDAGKKILLNCSMRGDKANSKKFLDQLSTDLKGDVESVNLADYTTRLGELANIIAGAGTIVLGIPLYVDGIPSAPLRLMEFLEYLDLPDEKKIYLVANLGFYESIQIKNMLSMVKSWCAACGFKYCGGIAIGAGEMTGPLVALGGKGKGPGKNAAGGLSRIANAINADTVVEDIFADAHNFPRSLYMMMGNMSWKKNARKNKVRRRALMRQLD